MSAPDTTEAVAAAGFNADRPFQGLTWSDHLADDARSARREWADRVIAELDRLGYSVQPKSNAEKAAIVDRLFYYDSQNDVHVFAHSDNRLVVGYDTYVTALFDLIASHTPTTEDAGK